MRGTNTVVKLMNLQSVVKESTTELLETDIATENVNVNEVSEEEEPDIKNLNYGKKLTGPWAFGMCQKKRKWCYRGKILCCRKKRQINNCTE